MKNFIEIRLSSIKNVFEIDNYFLSSFIFRGQENSHWELTTSLERIMTDYSPSYSFPLFGYETEEKWMIDEFKKKYPLFSSHLPKHNDNVEWLAIMQHHGAPTRLLDFTHSFFVSLYFSIIDAKSDSAIWCVNRIRIRDLLRKRFNLKYIKGHDLKDIINNVHIDFANEIIANTVQRKKYEGSIIPIEPNIYTERLSKQQGIFLMPTDSSLSFMKNLTLSFDSQDDNFENLQIDELIEYSKEHINDDSIDIIKIVVPQNLHSEIIKKLKEMNITAEILFPGIDGLAKSLVQSHIRR